MKSTAAPHGLIHVESDRQFRRTNATLAQVVEAFRLLVAEAPKSEAAKNARRVVALLGHTLPEKS